MRKIVLAYNPVSGHAVFKKKLDWIIGQFQQRGIALMPYRTRPDAMDDFADFVHSLDPEGVIAAGGDGTVHIVANLMQHGKIDLPLGIIGSGTSNDFATYLGINTDLTSYLDIIAERRTRPVDLGRVGDDYFINVASAGMMTDIAHEVNVRLKNALGKLAYYLKAVGEVPKIHPISLSIEADGRHYDANAYLFVVVNSSTVGSMKHIADDVQVDDGLLDLLAIQNCSLAKLAGVTKDLLSGKSVAEKDAVIHIKASKFTIAASEPLQSDLDGEVGPMLPLHIETVKHALSVYC